MLQCCYSGAAFVRYSALFNIIYVMYGKDGDNAVAKKRHPVG